MAAAEPWLDKSVLQGILQTEEDIKGSGGSVSIIKYSSAPAVDAGCNFLSAIWRVKVDYHINNNNEVLSRLFIVKAPLPNSVMNEDQLTENELQMYNEIIPKMHEVAQLEVAPKRYTCSLPGCLVMEDLSEAGYQMCNTYDKLDVKHTKAALITVAKFHAASIAVKHKYPNLIHRNGTETVYTHDPKYAKRFKPRILMRLYAVARVLQTIDSFEQFGDVLIDAGEAFWDLIVQVFNPSQNKLNVLNHGDFWTNNMLFKYNSEGNITDVRLVDYQIRRYCSPAIDLLYLFWTSTDTSARARMYELLEMYRHTLNSSLAGLGCPERLSRQELKEHISKCSPMILALCLYLPVIFPDPDCPFDVTQVEASDESMMSFDFDVNPILIPFKSLYYRPALLEMCKELDNMKIFQILLKNEERNKQNNENIFSM